MFDLPSRRVPDACRAAGADVSLLGAFRCDSALPAADFDLFAVDESRRVLEAFDAALRPVSLPMAFTSGLRTPHWSATIVPKDTPKVGGV